MTNVRRTLSDDEKAQLQSIDLRAFTLAVVSTGYVLADDKIAGFIARTLTSRYLWVRMDGTYLEFDSGMYRTTLIQVIKNNTGANEVVIGGHRKLPNFLYRR